MSYEILIFTINLKKKKTFQFKYEIIEKLRGFIIFFFIGTRHFKKCNKYTLDDICKSRSELTRWTIIHNESSCTNYTHLYNMYTLEKRMKC